MAAAARCSGRQGKAAVALWAAIDLAAIGLLSFGWIHVLVRFVLDI